MLNLSEEKLAMLKIMATKNTPSYNFNKAIEETTEFNEVILKLQTKSVTNPRRPPVEEALKEYGDVVYRGFVALMVLFEDYTVEELKEAVNDHIDYKLTNLEKYHKNKEYIGGL